MDSDVHNVPKRKSEWAKNNIEGNISEKDSIRNESENSTYDIKISGDELLYPIIRSADEELARVHEESPDAQNKLLIYQKALRNAWNQNEFLRTEIGKLINILT